MTLIDASFVEHIMQYTVFIYRTDFGPDVNFVFHILNKYSLD